MICDDKVNIELGLGLGRCLWGDEEYVVDDVYVY